MAGVSPCHKVRQRHASGRSNVAPAWHTWTHYITFTTSLTQKKGIEKASPKKKKLTHYRRAYYALLCICVARTPPRDAACPGGLTQAVCHVIVCHLDHLDLLAQLSERRRACPARESNP